MLDFRFTDIQDEYRARLRELALTELLPRYQEGDGEVYKIVPQCSVQSYCATSPNSVGLGAVIGSTGSSSIAAGDFTLEVDRAVPGQTGIFFYGVAFAAARRLAGRRRFSRTVVSTLFANIVTRSGESVPMV